MKIGDKIKIIETGRVGYILDETNTAWKIDFLDGNKPVLVLKSEPMEIVEAPVHPQKPSEKPKKEINWNLFIAIAVGLGIAIAGLIIF